MIKGGCSQNFQWLFEMFGTLFYITLHVFHGDNIKLSLIIIPGSSLVLLAEALQQPEVLLPLVASSTCHSKGQPSNRWSPILSPAWHHQCHARWGLRWHGSKQNHLQIKTYNFRMQANNPEFIIWVSPMSAVFMKNCKYRGKVYATIVSNSPLKMGRRTAIPRLS